MPSTVAQHLDVFSRTLGSSSGRSRAPSTIPQVPKTGTARLLTPEPPRTYDFSLIAASACNASSAPQALAAPVCLGISFSSAGRPRRSRSSPSRWMATRRTMQLSSRLTRPRRRPDRPLRRAWPAGRRRGRGGCGLPSDLPRSRADTGPASRLAWTRISSTLAIPSPFVPSSPGQRREICRLERRRIFRHRLRVDGHRFARSLGVNVRIAEGGLEPRIGVGRDHPSQLLGGGGDVPGAHHRARFEGRVGDADDEVPKGRPQRGDEEHGAGAGEPLVAGDEAARRLGEIEVGVLRQQRVELWGQVWLRRARRGHWDGRGRGLARIRNTTGLEACNSACAGEGGRGGGGSGCTSGSGRAA